MDYKAWLHAMVIRDNLKQDSMGLMSCSHLLSSEGCPFGSNRQF